MAAISLGTMVSGLPKDIVERLMDAEREPVRQLETKKQNEQAKLKLAQELVTKINGITAGLKDVTRFREFRDLKADIGRPEIMDVSIDKALAEPGSYQVEVVQLAGHSSMMSNGQPDPNDTQIGTGYFSYELPNGDTKEVYINEDNSTLNGLAKLINGQKDMNLRAIVVDDGSASDSPYRLIVTHNKTGEVNDAEFPNFYFLDGDEDFYLDQEKPAQNSILKVNGFNVEFDSNKISTLFPGITMNLKDAAPGKEFTVSIGEDTKSSKGKAESIVQKINEVLGFVQQQNKLDKDSNTKNTLGGDVTLQTLEYKLRNLVMTPLQTSEGQMRLSDFGITFNRTGLLDIAADKLEKVMNTNFNAVADFFTGESNGGDGFNSRLSEMVNGLTRQEGVVQVRVDGIQRRIKEIDTQIETKERQLSQTEKNLKEKFARLEGTMASLKSQQAQVSSMGGGGGVMSLLG